MIYVSEAYKNACDKSERKSYIIAKYGQFDKKIKSNINSVVSNDLQLFSNKDKTYNDIKETKVNYITCEPNRVLLNSEFCFISNKNKNNISENIAFFSNRLSNENGETNTKITYNFNSKSIMTNIILYFQEICSQIDVKFYNDNELICNINIDENYSKNVEVKVPESYLENTFNKIEIIINKTEFPYRYVKLNEIDFGNFQIFSNNEIIDINIIDELSIDSSELSANYLSLIIDDNKQEYNILNPANKLSNLQEKQEITVYHYLKVFDTYKEVPLGTFLLKDFKSGGNKLQIEAYDDTYFMNKIYYGSNFYNNVRAKDVFVDLFNYFNYANYIIDDELNNIYLTGYIPVVQFNEAIRLIAEASRCLINKDRYGKLRVFPRNDKYTASRIFPTRLQFKENHEKNLFNNIIDINEYSYTLKENQEVFNAELERGIYTIKLSKFPIIPETLVKAEENIYYSIRNVTATSFDITVGTDKTKVVLNANLMEQTNIVRRYKKEENIEQEEFTISRVDNTLITLSNSKEVADWKFDRKNIVYRFDTLTIPYIETGDVCGIKTIYNQMPYFNITRIEYDKSFIQHIEGE